jgi:putative ubiquitin-RnfH superfamily antitoxin RatB of RatAB toxin-antitoxin module
MKAASAIVVTVAYSPTARGVHVVRLELQAGACVRDALAACAWDARFAAALSDTSLFIQVGVWGKKVSPHHRLNDQDRVEIYRPLRVDPKVARRERFKKQGARSAGLFAKRRPGAKAGY